MEKASKSNSIVEERKEYMVSLNGDTEPVFRTAHFIKTSENTTMESHPPSFMPFSSQPKFQNPKKINVRNWVGQHNNWADWVEKMEVLHGVTWKQVGIFDAIKCSTLNIIKHGEIFTPFVERWCPDTNTFVFPWGEASITLEDMIVLGCFSVLGSSVNIGFDTKPELRDVYKRLKHGRSELIKSNSRKPTYGLWMKMFKDSGIDIEHEAFLAYWLSKYVFPHKSQTIIEHALSISVHLASGTRIALAPAVLASIYRGLSNLKSAVDKGGSGDAVVFVSAPLVLVQVWVWERFVKFRPMPSSVAKGRPRLCRWSKLKGPNMEIEHLWLDLDSAGEYFQWRPYVTAVQNLVFPRFYSDREEWISVGDCLDEDLMSFVRCLMPSELVGIEDYIEKYSPHRVSMQFGLDQDIPEFISQCNTDLRSAWHNYNKPVTNLNLYIPPRSFKPDVTVKYLKWWKGMNFSCKQPFKAPGPKGTSTNQVERQVNSFRAGENGNGNANPAGFKRKHYQTSEGEYGDEDDVTIAEHLRRTQSKKKGCGSSCDDICKKDIKRRGSSVELIETDVQNFVAIEQPIEDMDDIATGIRESSVEIVEGNVQNLSDAKQPKAGLEEEHRSRESMFDVQGTVNEIFGENGECLKLQKLELDIKNQIRELEREVAMLKAARGF